MGKLAVVTTVLGALVSLAAAAGGLAGKESSIVKTATQPSRTSRPAYSLTDDLPSSALTVERLLASNRADEARLVAAEVAATYLSSSPHRPLKSADYVILCQILQAVDDRQAKEKAVEAWYSAFTTDQTHRASMTPRELLTLGRLLKDSGKDDRVNQAASFAESQLTDNQGIGQSPSIEQLAELEELADLAGSASFRLLVKDRLTALSTDGGRFRKELAPFEILQLASSYRLRKDTESPKNLATFVVKDYLTEPGLGNAVYPAEWILLAGFVADCGDTTAKEGMLGLLRQRLAENRMPVVRISRQDLTDFVGTLGRLGCDASVKQDVVSRWLRLTNEWSSLEPELRDALVNASVGDGEAFGLVDSRLAAKYASGNLTPADYKTATAVILRLGGRDVVRQWARRPLERLLSSTQPSIEELAFAAGLLSAQPAALEGSNAESLVKKLAAMARQSVEIEDSTYEALAGALGNHSSALDAEMVAPDGQPRLTVVKVLAWLHRGRKTIRPFIAKLSKVAGNTQGDTLAEWHLAMAYAVSLTGEPKVRRTDGNAHLQQALTAATSDPVRLACVEELSAAGRASSSYAFPLQVIQSVRDQFDAGGQQKLDEIAGRLRRDQQLSTPEQTERNKPSTESSSQPAADYWQRLFDRKRATNISAPRVPPGPGVGTEQKPST